MIAAKCARAHFTSKWSRQSHRPPQGRPTLLLRACIFYALGGEWYEPADEAKLWPTLLLRACIFYALGGEWYEPADEAKLRGHVQKQAHTRIIVQPNEIPGKDIPEYAAGAREIKKSFAKEAQTLSLTPGLRQQSSISRPGLSRLLPRC
jgi:hypothetical protein